MTDTPSSRTARLAHIRKDFIRWHKSNAGDDPFEGYHEGYNWDRKKNEFKDDHTDADFQIWMAALTSSICTRLEAENSDLRGALSQIANAGGDCVEKIAQLESALTQARELMRAAAKTLSWSITQMDPNLTKHICALCHSWVWDDSEENRKEINHTPDCLVAKLRAAAGNGEGN